jgi:hypothetical protein
MIQAGSVPHKIARVLAGVSSAVLVILAFGQVILLLKGPVHWPTIAYVLLMMWIAYRLYFYARTGK